MDYTPMLEFHEENGADVTLAVTRMPEEELYRFGTLLMNADGQVTHFQEKVKNPESNLVSMGVYIFNRDVLRQWLEGRIGHDFGRHIFPKMAAKGKVFAHVFDGYWRDIGTVESYWQANMEILAMSQTFLSDIDWPLYTKEIECPPTKIFRSAHVTDCLLSSGCKIEGQAEHSILSPGVTIAEGAVIKDSIIMDDTMVGQNSIVDHAILDKQVVVEAGCHIGFGDDYRINRNNPKVLNNGLTIVGKRTLIPSGYKIGRNCIIYDNVAESDFPGAEIQSGETVRPKRKPIRIKV
jgi:glucose-1-phosphate adenylyltransferase